MASSSKPKMNFKVFLSFRGSDVRKTFLGHLYAALDRTGIFTYLDLEKLKKGAEISLAIRKALRESDIAVIIFSEDFASSRWCLEEVVEIMEYQKQGDLMVLPVFYKIEPGRVRRQEGSYEYRMRWHRVDSEEMNRWKKALSTASDLWGLPYKDGCEAELIKKIVQWISQMKRFDVFLSFRGEDVRKPLVDGLNKALVKKGIKTFMDSENLVMGQDFPQALKDAIEHSNTYVVVFSENYAESSWCLKELVQIMRKNKRGQRVLRIFYKVEPGKVREQLQSYEKALSKHETQYGKRSVQKWRVALFEAVHVKGIHLCDGNEDAWIPCIVEGYEKMKAEISES